MYKTLTLVFVQIWLMQNGPIMVEARIPTIKVNEQSMIVKHYPTVYTIHFLALIKPSFMGVIVSGLPNFNKSPITQPLI
jgi:hypothetical protein